MTMTRKNWYNVVPLFLTNHTNLLTYPIPLELFTPQCSKIQKKECNFLEFSFGQSCSWHQSTKPQIRVSPFFSMNFSQFNQMKKKQTFHWSKTKKKSVTVNFVSFSTAEAEKLSWKKLGKQGSRFGGFMSRTRYLLNFHPIVEHWAVHPSIIFFISSVESRTKRMAQFENQQFNGRVGVLNAGFPTQ